MSWSRRRRVSRPIEALVALTLLTTSGVGLLHGQAQQGAPGSGMVLRLVAKIQSRGPHDAGAFTQGLVWREGDLFESTGLYGESSLRELDSFDGSVSRRHDLEDRLFGEGLAMVGDRLIQLTWREGQAIAYDLETFRELERFEYRGEGWGLCFDGHRLVMSDGTPTITFRDPKTFELLEQIRVTLDSRPVGLLNELECAEGWIYANVLGRDSILRIDPANGEVVAVIDASHLYPPQSRDSDAVLNGIAYDAERETFYLTGKLWPEIFEVVFVPPGS